MSGESDLIASFKINGKIHDIEFSSEEKILYNRLLYDNEYTLDYLNSLITTGVINLENELQEIYRLNLNGKEENKIFPPEYKNSNDNKDKWNGAETCILIEKYEDYIKQVGPYKVFRSKKAMWEQIANDINTVLNLNKTAVQVENRFKTLLRRKEFEYNKIKPEDHPYTEKLKSISLERPSRKRFHKSEDCDDSFVQGDRSVRDILEKIHMEREASKERRHNEKLALLRELEANNERRHQEKLTVMREYMELKVPLQKN